MGADAVTTRSLLLDQVQPSAGLPWRAGTRVPAPRPGDISAGSRRSGRAPTGAGRLLLEPVPLWAVRGPEHPSVAAPAPGF